MTGCEGFEIAIEMRLHGAADRDASERLDAHMTTCEACRRFEIAVKTSEKTMRESGGTLGGAFDAKKMREKIRRAQWEHWIDPLVVAAGFFCFIALAALDAWVSGDPFALAKYPRVIVFFAAVTALFVLRSAQTVFGLRRAERRGEDLLPALRRDVGRRFRATVFATVVLGSLGLFFLLLAPFTTPSPRHDVGDLLLVAGLIGGAIYNSAVALPRLRRERAELA
jgi:amino acid transporter